MIIVPDDPPPVALDDALSVVVTKVFDGDGFLAKVWHPLRQVWVDRVSFRFAFIDAPELEQPFGPEARDFLSGIILTKALRLDPIAKASTGGVPIDKFKRILCMGFLTEQMEPGRIDYYLNGRCSSGFLKRARPATRNIELEMIVNGWAWVVEQYAFEREEEYFAAQEDAWRNGRGLWSMDQPEPPWQFKERSRRSNVQGKRHRSLF
jgi:endonuclease YncB( thermonuclease family)